MFPSHKERGLRLAVVDAGTAGLTISSLDSPQVGGPMKLKSYDSVVESHKDTGGNLHILKHSHQSICLQKNERTHEVTYGGL